MAIRSGIPQPKKFDRLIQASPSPRSAKNHLLRLIEASAANALGRIPATEQPALFRLLGGSAFLSDVLIREGRNWPELFLQAN